MKLIIALLASIVVCFGVEVSGVPRTYKTYTYPFHSFKKGRMCSLEIGKGILFVEKGHLVCKELEQWHAGDEIELCIAYDKQEVVPIKNIRRQTVLMAHRSEAVLPRVQKPFRFFAIRCSGSTFFQTLVRNNLPALQFIRDVGYKHWPNGRMLNQVRARGNNQDQIEGCTLKAPNLRLKEDPIHFMLVRSPYDWVRSLYKNAPRVLNFSYSGNSMMDFLERPVLCSAGQRSDVDLFTHKWFDDPIAFRNGKLKLLLSMMQLSDKRFFMDYETLAERPEAVIAEIASRFSIRPRPFFSPAKQRMHSDQKYKPTKYTELSDEEKAFIDERLDRDLERRLGYGD